MDHLLRELAPISEAAWTEIEQEATRSLRHFLAARKLIDFTGPLGWEAASVTTGRVAAVASTSIPGVEARRRRSLDLVEYRTPFALDRSELDAADRGAPDIDLDAVVDASRSAAQAEDNAVFHGAADQGITGITEASPHAPIRVTEDYEQYTRPVAKAVAALKDAGVGGPYAIALGPRCYRGVIESTERGGYPILEHIRLILGGPVVWAPAVDGAVVLSQRGGDYELVVGQDFAIGYLRHDAESVELYLEESFTVRINTPEAAIHLAYDAPADDAPAV
jgi:uncharacterized linocin/CFP29 family protein